MMTRFKNIGTDQKSEVINRLYMQFYRRLNIDLDPLPGQARLGIPGAGFHVSGCNTVFFSVPCPVSTVTVILEALL
jgi:hypothetical protein